jgi:hypothetical protein
MVDTNLSMMTSVRLAREIVGVYFESRHLPPSQRLFSLQTIS